MERMNKMPKAIVLLSGGMDSATCLAIAQADGYDCIALSFDYGQRSQAELEAAAKLADHLQVPHQLIRLDPASLQGSALTDPSIEVPETSGEGIPITYVPARNTLFLAYALGVAEVADADAVFIGANVIDYSGYPDCRPEFLEAFQRVMTLGTKRGVEGRPIELKTPLIELSKAQIIEKALSLELDLAQTISCYQTDDEGRACGRCDSCQLRKAGFEAIGVPDPTVYVHLD